MSSDNTAPILSRADTVNLISSLRFHDCTDDERAAIHLKLTTSDAGLRIEIQRLTEERIKALDAELSALRAELAETKDTLKEHEEEHWCFNAEHGQVIIERDRLRAELEAVKAERDNQYEFNAGQIAKYAALEAEHVTVLCFVRSRLIGLRHEACNDELHELSEELTSILSFIDAAISQTAQPEEKTNPLGAAPKQGEPGWLADEVL